jgi:hypothetical protein
MRSRRPWRIRRRADGIVARAAARERTRACRAWTARTLAALLLLAAWPAPGHAQFLPFGRNKVSYGNLRWEVLKTEHFDIYHDAAMDALARKGATFAEQSFRLLEQKFGCTVARRIPLVFYSSPIAFQQTNVTPGFIPDGVGGFFEFLKGRVVIPSSGSLEQFRHVINHELVHVFMHTRIEDVLHEHGQPADRYPPLWFVEGLAEYYSTTWDSQAEMLLRDAVITGYAAPLTDIWAISGSFLMYKEGQLALTFMAEEYGPETVTRLIENLWRSAEFSEVLRYTTGRGYEDFDREWFRWMKRRFFPLVATRERPSDVAADVVSTGFNTKPAVLRDGDSLSVVYIANVTGYSGIYRVPLQRGVPRELVEGERTDQLEAFHLFQSRMSVNRDGMLAFVTKSGESDVLHLYDLRAERLARTLSFDGLVMLGSLSWSPDGRRIAFSAVDTAGLSDLFITDVESGTLTRLTRDLYDDRDPAWSPDGRAIAFVTDRVSYGRAGVYALCAIDPVNRRITTLLCEPWSCLAPAWNAAGTALAFTGDRDGTHDLFVLDLRAGRSSAVLRRASSFLTAAFDPVWTDEGDLVFTAFDRYSFQIRRLPALDTRLDSLAVLPHARFDPSPSAWTVPDWQGATTAGVLRYEKEYELDIAQSQISTDPVFGTMGGAVLSLSDILGNDRYYFLIYNTAQSSGEFLSSWNLAISRVSMEQRAPYAYGIFTFSGRRYDFLDPDEYFYERAFGGYFAAGYPLSKFDRVEGQVSVTSSDKEALYDIRQRKALLLTNSVSFVRDNALGYYTGPLDGMRFNLTLASTTDVQYSNVNYFSVMADYRRYFRLGLRSTVATRFEVLYNQGKEARRYFLGGSWDLRGWPRWSIRGTKRWLASCELRFPLLDRVGLDLPFGSIDLGVLRGALYADVGNAWDNDYRETLGAIGAGLRFSLFGALVLRYDFGKRIENNFSRLQDGLYQQFFFGWDF